LTLFRDYVKERPAASSIAVSVLVRKTNYNDAKEFKRDLMDSLKGQPLRNFVFPARLHDFFQWRYRSAGSK
jgi:hypothetical protein